MKIIETDQSRNWSISKLIKESSRLISFNIIPFRNFTPVPFYLNHNGPNPGGPNCFQTKINSTIKGFSTVLQFKRLVMKNLKEQRTKTILDQSEDTFFDFKNYHLFLSKCYSKNNWLFPSVFTSKSVLILSIVSESSKTSRNMLWYVWV